MINYESLVFAGGFFYAHCGLFGDRGCLNRTDCACSILLLGEKIKKFISLFYMELCFLCLLFFGEFRTKRASWRVIQRRVFVCV